MLLSINEQLAQLGIEVKKELFVQLELPVLVEHALHNQEAELTSTGALNMLTGKFTGRSPKDRFLVDDAHTHGRVDWNAINQPISGLVFDQVYAQVTDYLSTQRLYVRHSTAVTAPSFAQHILTVCQKSTQDLFVKNMFIEVENPFQEAIDWTILVASELNVADHASLGLPNSHCVAVDLSRKIILVVGTSYTGEIKKSIFSVLNYILPVEEQILTMHCSANVGKQGDTALFFGLSGTGKTTLSNDPQRFLVGDDEHGWSAQGIFNFEGGCYAKVIDLTASSEPDIYKAIKFGALLENVVFHPGTREVDYSNSSITENTRVSYPIEHIRNYKKVDLVAEPENIFFLSADAFGVLPPISLLSVEQAMYYFINGYTSKVAGTEIGVQTPVSTFSACFGAAFLPLHPMEYADLLQQKLTQNPNCKVWLVNTGWVGGPYGVGRRIKLNYTRALIKAALNKELADVDFTEHEIFKLRMPVACTDVPDQMLNPKALWSEGEAYDRMALQLQAQFEDNYKKYKQF